MNCMFSCRAASTWYENVNKCKENIQSHWTIVDWWPGPLVLLYCDTTCCIRASSHVMRWPATSMNGREGWSMDQPWEDQSHDYRAGLTTSTALTGTLTTFTYVGSIILNIGEVETCGLELPKLQKCSNDSATYRCLMPSPEPSNYVYIYQWSSHQRPTPVRCRWGWPASLTCWMSSIVGASVPSWSHGGTMSLMMCVWQWTGYQRVAGGRERGQRRHGDVHLRLF